jgi:hypothetical protein
MSSIHEVVESTGDVVNTNTEPIEDSGPVEQSEVSNTAEGGGATESLYSDDGKDWGDEPTPIPSPTKELKNLAAKVNEFGNGMKTMEDVMGIIVVKLNELVNQNQQLRLQIQQQSQVQSQQNQEPKYADVVKDDGALQPVVEEPSPPEEASISTIIAEFCRVFGKSIPNKKEDLSTKQVLILERYFTTTTYRKVIATVNSSIEGVFYSKTLIVGDHIESASDFYIRKCIINILQFMYGVFHSKFDIGRLDEDILISGFIKSGIIERGEDSPVKITGLGHKWGTVILEQFNC